MLIACTPTRCYQICPPLCCKFHTPRKPQLWRMPRAWCEEGSRCSFTLRHPIHCPIVNIRSCQEIRGVRHGDSSTSGSRSRLDLSAARRASRAFSTRFRILSICHGLRGSPPSIGLDVERNVSLTTASIIGFISANASQHSICSSWHCAIAAAARFVEIVRQPTRQLSAPSFRSARVLFAAAQPVFQRLWC